MSARNSAALARQRRLSLAALVASTMSSRSLSFDQTSIAGQPADPIERDLDRQTIEFAFLGDLLGGRGLIQGEVAATGRRRGPGPCSERP